MCFSVFWKDKSIGQAQQSGGLRRKTGADASGAVAALSGEGGLFGGNLCDSGRRDR